MAKRVAKTITNKEDIDFLLNFKVEDISSSFIMNMYGEFDTKPRFNPYDIISIPPNTYHKNKNTFTTTTGLWIYNKYFIEEDLFHILGYINKPITKKVYNEMNDKLAYAVLEDKITVDQLKAFIEKTQQFMPFSTIYSPSYSMDMLLSNKKIDKKKDELLKKYKKEIDSGDILIVDKIQSELLDYAKELLKDDPAMDVFNSGARGDLGNNFKNLYIMKGIVKDPDPNKGYNIITSSLMDGVSRDEYAKFANSLAAGPYSRSKKTEIGGYWEKLFLQAFQHLKLDKQGTDCGTTNHIVVKLTPDVIGAYMYSYIIEGGKLVELTSENRDKYLNKTVKVRFLSMCESKKHFCSKCAGTLFYRLDVTNIGMAMPQLAAKLKLIQMKSFHDSQVRFTEMDPMIAFNSK